MPPGYRRERPPARAKLDPFLPIIAPILEADKGRLKQQRPTAKQIFERLRDAHGFSGVMTLVTDDVREQKRRTRAVFVPLAHSPGHAQLDFGETLGERLMRALDALMGLPPVAIARGADGTEGQARVRAAFTPV